jgi:hypothetical protein
MRSEIEKTKVVFFSTAFCSPRAISSFTAFGEKFAFFRIVRKSKDYTIKDIAQNIQYPTLIQDAEKR